MTSSLIKGMAAEMGLLEGQVETIVRTAPLRYKVFSVPKRTGGLRKLAQPAREVKWLQYWLSARLEPRLPVHKSVTAYRAGCSIRKNAEIHSSGKFLLKMDFTNFFPSITEVDFRQHIGVWLPNEFSSEDLEVMSRVLFWTEDRTRPLKLCIGAPTSPFLSNTILFEFDSIISKQVASDAITYTRYADDLTFSSSAPNRLKGIDDLVQAALSQITYPRLTVNTKKTVHASRATRRVVTGVVIRPDGGLSVGRDRKRMVRAMYHRSKVGLLNQEQIDHMNGLINFIESIEPGFARKLRKDGS